MKTSDIGINQELQANGMIADSWIRRRGTDVLWMWIIFNLYSIISYEWHFWVYSEMLKLNQSPITQQTYFSLVSQLQIINWEIFLFFGIAVFAPKAIQKFAEVRTGIKSTTESSSESSLKTTIQ